MLLHSSGALHIFTFSMPLSGVIEQALREIDNRITHQRINLMKKKLVIMDQELDYRLHEINSVNKIFDHVLMKDKPVGSAMNAIRHMR